MTGWRLIYKKGRSEWNECSGKSIILSPTMREEGSPVLSSLQKISDINSENTNMLTSDKVIRFRVG